MRGGRLEGWTLEPDFRAKSIANRRSIEKGIVVLNKKSGDFGSYALPRLSIESQGQEGEPLAPAQSAVQTGRSSILCRIGEKPVTIVRIS